MTLTIGEASTIRLDIANSAPAGASIVSGTASAAGVSGKGAEAHDSSAAHGPPMETHAPSNGLKSVGDRPTGQRLRHLPLSRPPRGENLALLRLRGFLDTLNTARILGRANSGCVYILAVKLR
jgi:hypothetical protein